MSATASPHPAADTPTPAGASLRHLLERFALLESRVAGEVSRRQAADGAAEAPRFRGLFLTDARVAQLLDDGPETPLGLDVEHARWLQELEADADGWEAAGATLRLRTLARAFGLPWLDVELLLVAAAPDVDRRFGPLYGYLNDDANEPRATIGLALLLCGLSPAAGAGRARLAADGLMVRHGLLRVAPDTVPALSRALQVPDRVLAFLLGEDAVDPLLTDAQVTTEPLAGPGADRLARALRAGHRLGYLRASRGTGAAAGAVAALAAAGRAALVLDAEALPGVGAGAQAGSGPSGDRDDPRAAATTATPGVLGPVLRSAAREARLRGAGLVLGPVEPLLAVDPDAVTLLARLADTLLLHGRARWDPAWSTQAPVVVAADRVPPGDQHRWWTAALGDRAAPDLDPVAVTAHLRLGPEQILRAGQAAQAAAAAAGRPVGATELADGVRSQNAAALHRLARRLEPAVGWDDLVVPPRIARQLHGLAARWRHRDQVLETWGLGRGATRGRGVSALFSGPSGTGKTLAAEVLAGELGLDLYVVDLSTVVDKYIGETAKNLDRIFDEADRVNGVLLFDEADALFGKRSAVSDAKDRFANLEVAFLLQRMEAYDGVALLTTNLAGNLDEAFLRRLDAIVDFPAPDVTQRRALWQAQLRAGLPCASDVDVVFLAERFTLSGSEIRNVALAAAYTAAASDQVVTMSALVRAAVEEHRKLGRHLTPADLGAYAQLLTTDG